MSVDKACFLEEQDLSLCRFWVPHLLPERAELLKSSWEEGLVIAMHVSFPSVIIAWAVISLPTWQNWPCNTQWCQCSSPSVPQGNLLCLSLVFSPFFLPEKPGSLVGVTSTTNLKTGRKKICYSLFQMLLLS